MNDGEHSTKVAGRIHEARTEEIQEAAAGTGATLHDSDRGGKSSGSARQTNQKGRQVDPGWDVVCSQPKR